ncbi:polysaccharide deacetylase family protein [Streptomyces sp. AK02-01A]|uniref:polysaccharide deacetylase family protein n=1 Tax=Streptomyces sp. AK02-01A TaxID=3028648 RepID=UPI0029AFD6FB|nr:polysaccharide deacetylase family protein [Streptomyces sp. AK02-01A]MDX3854579.1 polysaccharide deacetylase family protein [Streptomyces sp. AK02-01A]
MPGKKPASGPRITAALAAVASLSLVLSGCSAATISPGDARSRPLAGARAKTGVDCREARCIALTFDAGPSRDTPRLLDILKEKKVRATFFLLGKNHVVHHPDLVRRMAREGHEVGNHTWTHKRLTDLDADGIREELSRTQDAIAELTGHRPTLMRPPQGRTDREVSDVCRELGLAQVLWSATAKDYSTTDSLLIEHRVLDAAGPDGIILLHDIYQGTVPAVPAIIDELKKRGYTFVTVPELLAPGVPEPGKVYKP